MNNSTIIILILTIFFILKYYRKSNCSKKENFSLSNIKKMNQKLTKKISQRNKDIEEIRKKYMSEIVDLEDIRAKYKYNFKAKCLNEYAKLILARKSDHYIKNHLPFGCKRILKKVKNKFTKNACSKNKVVSRENGIKMLQRLMILIPSYEKVGGLNLGTLDHKYSKDYLNQYNSLFHNFRNKQILTKSIKKNTNNKKNIVKNKSKLPTFNDQFNIGFSTDISFKDQYNSLI